MQLGVTKVYAPIISLVLDKANLVLIKHLLHKNFLLVFISFFCTYLTVNYWNELEKNFQNNVRKNSLESAISFQRTVVCQAVFENFVVLIQHRRKNDLLYTYKYCLLPKLFINAFAALPEKTE